MEAKARELTVRLLDFAVAVVRISKAHRFSVMKGIYQNRLLGAQLQRELTTKNVVRLKVEQILSISFRFA